MNLSEAMVEQSAKNNVEDILYICPQCQRAFAEERGLTVHAIRSHDLHELRPKEHEKPVKDVIEKFTASPTSDGKPYPFFRCLKCKEFFVDSDLAAAHIVITPDRELSCMTVCRNGKQLRYKTCVFLFTGEEDRLCPDCGEIFRGSDKKNFYTHYARHRRKKKFACDQCPFTTYYKGYFSVHLTTHMEHRPRTHVCELCGKSYLARNGLIDHRKRVHNKKDKLYKCPNCPVTFYVKYQLTRHLKTHLGLRPFSCEECSQCFTTAYNLMVHQRIHSGEKPYQCVQCDAAFAQKNSLNVHMKKHQKV